jgi:hypothetical protein
MLTQDYSYFLLRILEDAALSFAGLLSIVLLVGAIGALYGLKVSRPNIRLPVFWSLLLAGSVSFMLAFYSATYEFEEHPEQLVFDSLPEGAPDCGTAWTGWLKSGYGISNPCPKGCYRGLVLRKKLSMNGFPPWPQYKRELQCWRRD